MRPDRFDASCRRYIAERCAGFRHAPTAGAQPEGIASLKPAAVAIVLVEAEAGAGTAFLLTERAAGLRTHAGQWALPGGRCDAGETAIEAALREVEEEVGLRLQAQDVLGTLDDYPTRSGYLITPVVIWGGSADGLQPNPDEVAAVHRIPLAVIEREEAVSFISIAQSDRPVVRLYIHGSQIHAPTAAVLYQFREVLAGRDTRVAHLEQPVFAWR